MNFLAHCDALIVDLRRCGGGEGYVDRLILSYLFEEPVNFSSFYTRYTDTTEQAWTMPHVPGPLMPDLPVYVLQSSRTASAAENVSYSLKALKRATIVGERSRGAANPVDELNFPELSICVAVSISQVINPVTGTSWERVGVEPDVEVPAEKALQAACKHAAEMLFKNEVHTHLRQLRQWALDLYEAELGPITLDEAALQALCGQYSSSVSVERENGHLVVMQIGGEPPFTLIPLGNNEFAVKEREARVKFNGFAEGNICEFTLTYAEGYTYTFQRKTIS
jgi:C-terminal processing protease CtpA/Prc